MQLQSLRKIICAAICATFTWATTCQAQEEFVVRITASSCGYSGSNVLTGFILKDKGIVTALHGVCGCKTIGLEDASGRPLGKAYVNSADLENDVALLSGVEKIDLSEGFEFSDVSKKSLGSQNITIIGYGHKVPKPKTTEDGNVRRTPVRKLIDCIPSDQDLIDALRTRNSPDIYNEVLDIEADIPPGCSGAPIIYNGKVIGIADGGLKGGSTGYCWAIPVSSVNFLPKSSLETAYSKLSKNNPESIFHSTVENRNSGERQPFSMVDSEVSGSASDVNSNNPEIIITSIDSRGGGYRIEHRNPSSVENGKVYMKKVFRFNSIYKSCQFDIGKGEIFSYDRTTTRKLTMSRLKERHPTIDPEEGKKVSRMNFNCKIYLGEKYGSAKKIWESEPVLKYSTTDSEQNNNPRTIHPPKNDVISLNGESKITCVCRYYDSRKDDYHIINVPYSNIVLLK
jgi:hypothetical protein